MSIENLDTYIALFTMAVVPIYIGSYMARNPPTKSEILSKKDVYMFPVIGSITLLSLYICFKFLSKEWLNFILQFYFTLISIGGLYKVLNPAIERVVPFEWTRICKRTIQLPFPTVMNYLFEISSLDATLSRGITFVIATIISVSYFVTKSWILNNIIGEAFSITSLELIRLGSFTNGAILLIGLFFYDIFWVFGTDVMVTVAKKFDGPIKVLWPRGSSFSLLGLGDIVIPGIFVSMMLRFDDHLRAKVNPNHGKTYFHACLVGYMVGLITTFLILIIFQHGQPALLYLVPGCLGSVLLVALVRGELQHLLNFTESEEKPKKKLRFTSHTSDCVALL